MTVRTKYVNDEVAKQMGGSRLDEGLAGRCMLCIRTLPLPCEKR